MKLVIVESPTKSKTIQKFIGAPYKVLSCYGHVRDLPKKRLGIELENNFQPEYVIPQKAKKRIKEIKKWLPKADIVILATDEDREGEAIAWHLKQILGLAYSSKESKKAKPYKRIVFHEITKSAIKEALKNPRKIDMNLVNAQKARRILDRIVGYKLSPFLWKKVIRGLSAGRVQSVGVRLVVEREREIKDFTPQEYWTITGLFKKQKSSKKREKFEADLIKRDKKTIPKLGIKSESEAQKILKKLKKAKYQIESIQRKERKRNPRPPFTTSSLQQESWNRFKFSAKFTMRIAQALYEKGLTTYHRTDSLNLSKMSLLAAEKFITKKYGKKYWAGFLRKYKTKGQAQEAHEAIRPTHPDRKPTKVKSKLNKPQFKIYSLIWKRFIASQMSPAVFDSTKVDILATTSKESYTLRASGQILKFKGFMKVYPLSFKQAELPKLKKKERLSLLKLDPQQHFTQPPPRFSEATLIKELKKNGVGRPSTFAPILTTIQKRNYIKKNQKKRFFPTEIGIIVNDLLVKHFPRIVDIKFTAQMKEKLDQIAQHKKEWTKVIKKFWDSFKKNLKKKQKEVPQKDLIEKTKEKCPKCKSPLVIRLGKYGKFYACSNFPQCKYTRPLPPPKIGVKCPKCKKGEVVKRRTKKGKVFFGCSRWPKCDFATWKKPTGKNCPKCNSPLVKTKSDKTKCSNPKCPSNKKSPFGGPKNKKKAG